MKTIDNSDLARMALDLECEAWLHVPPEGRPGQRRARMVGFLAMAAGAAGGRAVGHLDAEFAADFRAELHHLVDLAWAFAVEKKEGWA